METNKVIKFIEALSQTPSPSLDSFNQFAYHNTFNDIRRANLQRYLSQISQMNPSVLLVMEAPGYRGSRLTGVPVTSRRILVNGIPELGLYGTANGYQAVPEPGFEKINGEQSATAVWGTLAALRKVAAVWNSYPFHPHKAGLPLTNRAPRRPETELGMRFLQDFIDLFHFETVIAVGNVADDTLNRMSIEHHKVRHPAQGGKNDFVRGMREILE
jgi:uracil-DNA glycosylase